MTITTNDIKNSVGTTYYKRGIEYYAQRRVQQYKVSADNDGDIVINSTVKGSSGSLYQQNIDIQLDEDIVVIDGKCSCPIGYDYKHVAAVCLSYKTDTMSKVLDSHFTQTGSHFAKVSEVDKWLKNIENFATSHANKRTTQLSSTPQDYFLTYRLDGKSSYDKSKLSFYKSKFLKNGRISKGTKLDISKITHDFSNRELKNSDDKEILKLLKAFIIEEYYSTELEPLSGELGALLLEKIIATKRCYFNDKPDPIEMKSGIFQVSFAFKLYKEEYTLKSNIPQKGFRIIETEPPYLLDTIEGTLQELEIDTQMYKQLSLAPKIPKDAIAKVYTKVAQTLTTLKLDTPKAIKTKRVETKLQPSLLLSYDAKERQEELHKLELKLFYGEYEVDFFPQEPLASFYDDEQKVEIVRDLELEQDAKNRIESFGFTLEKKNNSLALALEKNNRQTQLTHWRLFLAEGVEQLEAEGWRVVIEDSFSLKFEPSCEVVVESEEKNNWFNLSFNFEFAGISQPIAPLVASIIAEFDSFENIPELVNIEVEENRFAEIQTKQLQPIIKTILELFDKKEKDESLKISSCDAHLLEFMDDDILWRGSKDILALSEKLKNFHGIEDVTPPECLNATLRDYQQEGLNWLNFLYEYNFCGILADDMGLGKTIQTLAHLSRLKEQNKLTNPSLIVMPTSLIANWKNEAAKFTPNLRVLSLHGNDRAEKFDLIEEYDILLTTYPLIVRDQTRFNEYKFMYIILDEAQKIKNHKTKMAVALKTLSSEHRVALSGTPIENHLGELWSIFSFLMPGFLDTISFFKKQYQTPIEKEHNFERQNLLNKRIKPFMIRRTKERVAKELPAKTEIIKYTQFGETQAKLYESIRVTMEQKVKDAVSAKGIGSSHITILDALLKLRQVCCDPSLLKIEEAQKLQESAKLELFADLVDELIAEGRKILVFSQFTSMLAIIEKKLIEKEYSYTKLTGSTRKREEAIEKFTKGNAQIFLISLKAGGVGLNLTEADTIIHYDPWWNPAVENQATDRAYRIGQEKAVFVYKLIVENSIEQKILELQEKKKSLQDGIYDDNKQQEDLKFSGNELLELLER